MRAKIPAQLGRPPMRVQPTALWMTCSGWAKRSYAQLMAAACFGSISREFKRPQRANAPNPNQLCTTTPLDDQCGRHLFPACFIDRGDLVGLAHDREPTLCAQDERVWAILLSAIAVRTALDTRGACARGRLGGLGFDQARSPQLQDFHSKT